MAKSKTKLSAKEISLFTAVFKYQSPSIYRKESQSGNGNDASHSVGGKTDREIKIHTVYVYKMCQTGWKTLGHSILLHESVVAA